MFLIDELNQTYDKLHLEGLDLVEICKKLVEVCDKRVPSNCDKDSFLNEIRKINFTFNQFTKSHPEFRYNSYIESVYKIIDDIGLSESTTKYLKSKLEMDLNTKP